MRLQDAMGETIRSIRTEKGLTLRDISKKAFISIGHLSQVEMGKKSASYDLVDAVANGLDMTTADLIKEVHDYLLVCESWEKEDE